MTVTGANDAPTAVDLSDNVIDPGVDSTGGQTITGTEGPDNLTGTLGDDVMYGLGGNDTLLGDFGDDLVDGGDGVDIVRGGPGDDLVFGGAGDDQVYGDDGQDTLEGGAGDDIVNGLAGDDILRGGAGNDRLGDLFGNNELDGGEGNDEFLGSRSGTDTSTGGSGQDVFEISTSVSNPTVDTITDFESGVGGDVFDYGRLLNELTNFDGATNPFESGHLRFVQSGSSTLFEVDSDGSANGENYQTAVVLQGNIPVSMGFTGGCRNRPFSARWWLPQSPAG